MALFGKDKVVLALGGGGSRGLAHLGVLATLEAAEIPIHGIVGTSVGAIVGASYALEPNAEALSQRTLTYLRSPRFRNDLFKRMMFGSNEVEQNFARSILAAIRKSLSFSNLIRRPSIFESGRLREVVADLVPDRKFDDARIPFAVPAIDLRPPREVLITTGALREAVTASCSLPGFFPPLEMDGMLLADVGVIGSVPVDAAGQFVPGALIVAVDLSSRPAPMANVSRGWDCIMRVESIASAKLNELELSRADVVVRPEIGQKYWSDFTELHRMVEAGAEATRKVIPEIKNRLQGWLRFIRK